MNIRSIEVVCCVFIFLLTPVAADGASEKQLEFGRLATAAQQEADPKASFNFPIRKVTIPEMPISDAILWLLTATDKHWKMRHFVFGLGYSREEEYNRNGVPPDQWKHRDPKVTIHRENTTLRVVVDDLCKQAGWSYKWADGRVIFIDDSRYTRRAKP